MTTGKLLRRFIEFGIVGNAQAKRQDAEADVSAWEREIDQLVYALYGLTLKGIKLIEGTR